MKNPQLSNVKNETMDDIVFAERNKAYGAYELRKSYNSNLLKAMIIVAITFIFTMYTPAIAKNLGWIHEKIEEKQDTIIINIDPKIEIEVKKKEIEKTKTKLNVKPKIENKTKTIANKEVVAVKPDEADKKLPPSKDELKNNTKIDTKDNTEGKTDPLIPEKDVKSETTKKKTIISIDDVTVKPHFIGDFDNYVNNHVDALAIDENSTGQATVYFILDEKGKVIKNSVRIFKSSGFKDIDKEAIRLVKEQPNYSPGQYNQEAIQVECKVVIDFENRE